MNLTKNNLPELCEIAVLAAKKAGQIINEYVDKNVTVNTKKGADSLASQVVTEADIKAQDAILKVLEPTMKKFNFALLTEESVDDKSRFEKDYFWCIDPMDGTLAFTEQTPGYAVSIALVAKTGEPQIGVVFDPLTNTLYHAISGQGAFKNHKKWNPDLSTFKNSEFTLYIDRSYLQNNKFKLVTSEIEKRILKLGFRKITIEELAGAVLNACWVIDKAPGCYFKVPKPQTGGGSLWDFAATACIANETGAFAFSLDGSPLDLNRSDSTFMNHKGVLYASNLEIASVIQQILLEH
jgi:3'(2'), 5'-bisphosphate nucleotidase/myo-inositol-1(or 4)-monophosphatase